MYLKSQVSIPVAVEGVLGKHTSYTRVDDGPSFVLVATIIQNQSEMTK